MGTRRESVQAQAQRVIDKLRELRDVAIIQYPGRSKLAGYWRVCLSDHNKARPPQNPLAEYMRHDPHKYFLINCNEVDTPPITVRYHRYIRGFTIIFMRESAGGIGRTVTVNVCIQIRVGRLRVDNETGKYAAVFIWACQRKTVRSRRRYNIGRERFFSW